MTCWPGAEDHCIQSLHVFHPARPHNPGHCIILTSILLHTILNSPAYYTQLSCILYSTCTTNCIPPIFHVSQITCFNMYLKILHFTHLLCTLYRLHTTHNHTYHMLTMHILHTTYPPAYMGLKPCSGSQILMPT